MNRSFVKAITRGEERKRYALDRLLLFSQAEWISAFEFRLISFLLQSITVFIFVLWSVDCLANNAINWNSYQYPVVFALFGLIFWARAAGRHQLIPLGIIGTVLFIDVFCVATALTLRGEVFAGVSHLVLYTSTVAVANSVLFKPRIALPVNLLILCSLAYAASAALDGHQGHSVDLQLVTRVLGVLGFFLWFSIAQYFAFSLYMRHQFELVEVHHLVAEMERNQTLNAENARMREDLVRTQRVQMVDSMTSTMAHEVNQPISCANNYIQAAQRWLSRSEPDVAEALASLAGAQDEIVRVGDRVMSVRRLMQRLSSEYTSIDLGELIDRAGSMVRRDLARQDIALTTVWDQDEDFQIFGCEEELIQVLMNLMSNAVDAVAQQPLPRRIVVTVAEADLGEFELVVADNGCGVPAGEINRVFDRLYSTKPGGSGLGLSLCKRIVANHGGTIALESEPGAGARVIVRFPRAEMRGGWMSGRRP